MNFSLRIQFLHILKILPTCQLITSNYKSFVISLVLEPKLINSRMFLHSFECHHQEMERNDKKLELNSVQGRVELYRSIKEQSEMETLSRQPWLSMHGRRNTTLTGRMSGSARNEPATLETKVLAGVMAHQQRVEPLNKKRGPLSQIYCSLLTNQT